MTTAQEAGTGRPAPAKQLRMGMIGIGIGATQIMPQMDALPEIDLMAGADTAPRVREAFQARYPEAHVYDSAEALCADPEVEAVWIATPNNFHSVHAVLAAQAGKHVVSEKPMALTMKEAEAMVEIADKSGVKLLCGHSLGFSPPVLAMRRIIRSGELGPLRALNNWTFTDWLLQGRQPEELEESVGGGVLYRQGPHQLDGIRLLGGGKAKTIRGVTGKWWAERFAVGYYSAFIQFETGVAATVTNNGYGYAMTSELVPWGDDRGLVAAYTHERRSEIRREIRAGTRDEFGTKNTRRIGQPDELRIQPAQPGERQAWRPTNLGIIIATCERGDIRQSEYGLYVYGENGVEDRDIGDTRRRPGAEDLIELYDAVIHNKRAYHDGLWGMATLELITGIMESSRTGKDVQLTHQVEMPDAYDP